MEFYIKVKVYWNASHINPGQDHFLSLSELPIDHDKYDDQGYGISVSFDSHEEAEDVVRQLDQGTYYLKHGEYARPDYTVVDEDNMYPESDCVDSSDALDLELIEEKDIPEEIREEMLWGLDVEYFDHNSETTTYTDCLEHGDKLYHVAYVVNNLSLERVDGDLSDICWEKPSFFVEEI